MFRVGRQLRLVMPLLAVTGGFLAGEVLGRLESVDGAPTHTLMQAERIEVPRLSIASAIVAERPSQTPFTHAQTTASIAAEPDPPSTSASAVLAVVRAPVPIGEPDRSSEVVVRQVLIDAQVRERAQKMVARGERHLEDGNVATARQFFLGAAEAGLARGAYLLGATYDSRELARLRVIGVQPNTTAARKWYKRAVELAASEANERVAHPAPGRVVKISELAVGRVKPDAVAKKDNTAFIGGAHRKKCGGQACSARKRHNNGVVSIHEAARRKCKGTRCQARGRFG